MSNQTLTIPYVNFQLLEEQRKHLSAVLIRLNASTMVGNTISVRAKELDSLNGLESMLNSWSDDVYHLGRGL